jgi:hypothetical protein
LAAASDMMQSDKARMNPLKATAKINIFIGFQNIGKLDCQKQ